jgi:hypothetical protein
MAILTVPVAAYFWFIDHFSVNVPYLDQWSDVGLAGHWYTYGPSFGELWRPHAVHRMLFPKIFVLGLTQFTHFNVVVEEYVSAVILIASAVLVVVTHRQRCRSTPLIWCLPVVVLLFSFVQYEDTLWGFQLAWYLVTLGLVTALYFLDRPMLTQPVFVAAVAASVIASYSSLQGLLVWPAGLVLLYLRRRSRQQLIVWCILAVVVTALYFYHLNPNEYANQTYFLTHPIASLKYFFFLIGSVVGVELTSQPGAEIAFGALVVAVSIGLVVRYWRRDEQSSRPFGVALVLYGLLFGATITQGRAYGGLWAPSRYSICGLLTLVGCYLILLDRPTDERRQARLTAGVGAGLAVDDDRWARAKGIGRATAWAVVALAVVLVAIFGTGHGYASAKTRSEDERQVADIAVNYKEASSFLLATEIVRGEADYSRSLLTFMAAHGLSVFGTSDRSYYASIGLLPHWTRVQTTIVIPSNGTILRGTRLLVAGVSDPSGVHSVEFFATDSSRHHSFIGVGKPTQYGWIMPWDTRTVPNGRYDLECVAIGYGSKRSQSVVSITVRN